MLFCCTLFPAVVHCSSVQVGSCSESTVPEGNSQHFTEIGAVVLLVVPVDVPVDVDPPMLDDENPYLPEQSSEQMLSLKLTVMVPESWVPLHALFLSSLDKYV